MKYRRTQKLIDSRFQLRMTMWFVGVTATVMTLQYFVLAERMSAIGLDLPNDSQVFFGSLTGELLKAFLATLGIALSVTMVTGILLTHRIAGPAYRFDKFLNAVMRGEHPDECRIRKNDELQDLCTLLNRVTAEMRAKSEKADDDRDSSDESSSDKGAEEELSHAA